jgi:signal peptidase I
VTDIDTALAADPGPPAPVSSIGRTIREWVVVIAVALGVALLIRNFAIAPFSIPSGSMHQTLVERDRILVNKLSYRLHDVDRGDVVVFEKPPGVDFGDPQIKDLIKRVIGLPGDVVEIRDCEVFVNGQQLEEPYRNGDCTAPGNESSDPDHDGRIVVPEQSYFVMGDNRELNQSNDGRYWGFVDERLIVGRAFVVVFPFGHWRWL